MKRVMVTGGTGSFSTAFVKRILKDNPERIVIYSRGEHLQESMAREFAPLDKDGVLRFFIGDVRDVDRLKFAMHGIDTVIHAAALKIVPILEYNPTECIATNIGGAENVVKAAIQAGVKRVIALSTDKAVNPINLYGASKLAAEKIFIAANSLSAGACAFSVVRYGNVVGSRGSVVPLFKKLALEGKNIPITDPRMTRFWITLDQAIDLVLLAHVHMGGREIYIPKIPSIRITDLARAIAPDRAQTAVGIRPGEKIHECLLTEDEARNTFNAENCYIIVPDKTKHKFMNLDMVKEGFRYTSNENDQWLTVEQLRESLSEVH